MNCLVVMSDELKLELKYNYKTNTYCYCPCLVQLVSLLPPQVCFYKGCGEGGSGVKTVFKK